MFLGFANFYRRFIQNFSRIAAPLTSILRTTDDEALSTQVTENKKNQDAPSGIDSGGTIDGDIKNLSSIVKSAKSKKPNFAKTNFGIDFLTSRAKKTFIHLQKAFIEAPILRHFDPECHIQIVIDASGYAIDGVLSQMTSDHLDQLTSNHVIHKNINPISSKFNFGQWHLVAFFF